MRKCLRIICENLGMFVLLKFLMMIRSLFCFQLFIGWSQTISSLLWHLTIVYHGNFIFPFVGQILSDDFVLGIGVCYSFAPHIIGVTLQIAFIFFVFPGYLYDNIFFFLSSNFQRIQFCSKIIYDFRKSKVRRQCISFCSLTLNDWLTKLFNGISE